MSPHRAGDRTVNPERDDAEGEVVADEHDDGAVPFRDDLGTPTGDAGASGDDPAQAALLGLIGAARAVLGSLQGLLDQAERVARQPGSLAAVTDAVLDVVAGVSRAVTGGRGPGPGAAGQDDRHDDRHDDHRDGGDDPPSERIEVG